MLNWLRKIWNKIFGKTIFASYYDNRKIKNKKQQSSTSSPVASYNPYYRKPDINIIDFDVENEDKFIDFKIIDDNASNEDKQEVKTFTKKWVERILTVSLIDVQFVFVLAFIGKDNIAETLGIAIVTEIVSIGLGYLFRGWADSHTQAKDGIEMEKVRRNYTDYNVNNTVASNDDSEAVG